jgi:hypothetical protein
MLHQMPALTSTWRPLNSRIIRRWRLVRPEMERIPVMLPVVIGGNVCCYVIPADHRYHPGVVGIDYGSQMA